MTAADPRGVMERAGVDARVISLFERQVAAVRRGDDGLVRAADIEPYDAPPLPWRGDRRPSTDGDRAGADALATTATIRLNGGLGTSMGMDRAKSLLVAHDGHRFLDLIVRQVLALRERTGARLPLTLLQSFRTSADCLAVLAEVPDLPVPGVPLELMQHRVPKLSAEELAPVRWPADPELEWCPPGHGDLYTVLHTTGHLDRLAGLGVRTVFVANADNLGARPTPEMASWFASTGAPFALETVRRTPSDRKGGHVARRRRDGRLVLRETAQTPPAELGDLDRHRFASTNNLWFDVAAMRELLAAREGDLRLPVIVNRKTVDPADPSSPPVVQLETAMGAAIEAFDGATTVEVGRDRFVPVKTTDDLLVVRSDCYRLSDDGALVACVESPPYVELGPAYRHVDRFDRRFPAGPPSLVDATSLVVRGDWTFGQDVRVVGHVELGGEGGHVADGTVLEGDQ